MSSQFTFRPVDDQDFALIASWPHSRDELYYFAPTAQWPVSDRELAEIACNRQSCTVALLDGQPAGYANFYRWQNQHCAIGNVIVSPDFRGIGVASALMKVMEQNAIERFSAHTLRVACFNSNTSGLRLYHQLGFRPDSMEQRVGPDGKPLMLIQLQKQL